MNKQNARANEWSELPIPQIFLRNGPEKFWTANNIAQRYFGYTLNNYFHYISLADFGFEKKAYDSVNKDYEPLIGLIFLFGNKMELLK